MRIFANITNFLWGILLRLHFNTYASKGLLKNWHGKYSSYTVTGDFTLAWFVYIIQEIGAEVIDGLGKNCFISLKHLLIQMIQCTCVSLKLVLQLLFIRRKFTSDSRTVRCKVFHEIIWRHFCSITFSTWSPSTFLGKLEQ